MNRNPAFIGAEEDGDNHSNAGQNRAARIAWFLGPRSSSWNGVSQHSLVMIDALRANGDFIVDTIEIPAEARSFMRYWWQLVLYPIRALRVARTHEIVVLYQEDLSFLIPFVRVAGGRVCIIFHHVQRRGQARNVIEVIKSMYISRLQPLAATADLIFAPSHSTAREISQTLEVKTNRLHVVPNPFDNRYESATTHSQPVVKLKARATLLHRFGIAMGDAFVLLNVGSDETRKNNITLLHALARLARKDVMLIRVGNPINRSNRAECRRIADESNLNVCFIDKIDAEDLRDFYHAASVYVSPSIQEGFGRTVIEAQMAGLPVIASDLPVYRDTMGISFLAVGEPTNPEAWATAINQLASDRLLASRLTEQGRENSRRFSSDVVAAILDSKLRGLIAEGRACIR